MHFTVPALSKLGWLLKNKQFRDAPLKTSLNLFKWEYVRIKNKPVFYNSFSNLKLKLYPNDGAARILYYFNQYEPEILGFWEKIIKPGMTVFDIGANIGLYSLFLSSRIGKGGKIHAFEPVRKTYQKMIENIKLNGTEIIHLNNMAVGSLEGEVELVIDEDSAKSYTRKIDPQKNMTHSESVPSTTIDSYCKRNNISKLDFMKIDVEGFEFDVLKGAQHTLQNNPPQMIQLEVIENFLQRNGRSVAEILDFTSIFGYHPFCLKFQKLYKIEKASQIDSDALFLIHKANLQNFEKFIV